MNSPLLSLRTLVLFLACTLATAIAAESPQLAEARAQLVEYYQQGLTESDNRVKQTKEKIAALEYIAQYGPATPAAAPKVINIDFPGGPMSSLVTAVNKEGGGFNVVGEKPDLAMELPPFSLRNADANSLANALNGLLQQRGFFLGSSGRAGLTQSPVYTLRKLSAHEVPGTSQIQSFQLGPYLEQQSVDDIVAAIRTAWELDPANKPDALRLKYHPPTGLLLVSGPHHGIQAVQIVLGQLRRSSDVSPKASSKSGPPPPRCR